MINFIKKYKGEIISFFLTFFLFLLILLAVGMFKRTILISDLEVQMLPLFKYLNLLLKGEVGLFSFNFGIGDSVLGTLYYYLLSPFNLLVLFIKNIDLLFILIILLKAAFASLFSYKFLKYNFNNDNDKYIILFSLFYGLSSYFISYNMFIQFLDVYMIFPLLLLGIDKIIKENKYTLYAVTLMFTIFFNYYFAYMVCIFIFIYYNYKLLFNKINFKDFIISNLKFIGISFLSCLTMSFILLPVVFEIGEYSRQNGLLFGGETLSIIFNLKDFVNHYILGNFSYVNLSNMYAIYIYTSIIVIPLIYKYFTSIKINKREKILSLIMFIILFCSIGINYINYMWHGFVPPMGLNGRYSFMFILFINFICCKSLINFEKFTKKDIIICFLSVYILVFLYAFIYYPRLIDINTFILFTVSYITITYLSLIIKKYNNKRIYLYIFLLILFVGLILLFNNIITLNYLFILLLIPLCIVLLNYVIKNRDVNMKNFINLFLIIFVLFSIYVLCENRIILGNILYIKLFIFISYLIIMCLFSKKQNFDKILILLIILELFYNGFTYLDRYNYKFEFDDSYQEVIDYIKENDDSLFYRIEDKNSSLKFNNSILYNYYGIDYFLSTIKKDTVKFFDEIEADNFFNGNNSILYDGSYHLLSSLLNIKYYIEDKNINNDIYNKIGTINKFDIYKNEEYLEYGYLTNEKIINTNRGNNSLEYINNIYKNMTNNDKDILSRVDVFNNNDNFYSFNNINNDDFYILLDIDKDKFFKFIEENDYYIKIYLNDVLLDFDGTFRYLINNKFSINEEIKINVDTNINSDLFKLYVYYYDEDIYKEDINILRNNQLLVKAVTKNKVTGTIDANKNGLLFISCMYSNDLDVYVDGEKVDKKKVLDTFIGINLDKGKHEITLKYNSNLFLSSFIPSLIGLGTLIILKLKKRNLI